MTYFTQVEQGFYPNSKDNVYNSLFRQYERILFESLITSFGLDIFIRDQHGGDVDTIHNVRQIGKDKDMYYKSKIHQQDYENKGEYNSNLYHSHANYRKKNKEVSKQKKDGQLIDAYTGKCVDRNAKIDLDHNISAKEVHNDPGRVLAGLSGEDLANIPENLYPTDSHINRSKKADSMSEHLAKHGNEYTEDEKKRMRAADTAARRAYNAKIAYTYYTSTDFWQHTAMASGKVGFQMGIRQALGFVLTEVWFSVREKLTGGSGNTLKSILSNISEGVRLGIQRAKEKYKTLLDTFGEGMVGGILSSLTSTLCNIFFTTTKNFGRVLRQSFASLVAAGKVLFFNPDNLLFGDRMVAALKIIATGASAVVGISISQAIAASGLGTIPVVGELLSTFAGVFATGALSCTLLYALDSCDIVQQIVGILNKVRTIDYDIAFYRQQADAFEALAAKLLAYDLESFKKQTAAYANIAQRLVCAGNNSQELSDILETVLADRDITLPYTGDFDSFMGSKENTLHFC